MRLVDLKVSTFGCVGSAEVSFGPGLNVLYGPNDLGKSSLAEAIRFALLLPPSSKEGERFESWHSDESPEVVLTFEAEPSHYYRVTKTFTPRSGSATLEFSRDGRSWTVEKRGRDVDGELRRMLSWGIPEPGGRGSPRGLPDSFLASTLLAPQDDVAGLLAQSLEEDRDATGKDLLSRALQALGEDPELVRVREAIQERVDEAFTATGRKRGGQSSPFRVMRDKVQAARDELDRVETAVAESHAVREEVQELGQQLLEAQEGLTRANAELERLERLERAQQAYDATVTTLSEAEDRVAHIVAEREAVDELHKDERRTMADLYEADKAVKAAEREREAADEALAQARRRLDAAESDLEGRAAARREALEARLRELEGVEREAKQRIERAREAGQQARERTALEQRLAETRAEMAQLDAVGGDDVAALRAERELLDGVQRWLGVEEARTELARATKARSDADHLLSQATERKAQAARLERELSERPVPDHTLIADLRRLREKKQVAAAKLDVGLTVEVKPRQPFALEVTRDGQPGPTQLQGDPITLEARRAMELSIGAVADISIAGGGPEAREELEKLEARWQRVALPRLEEAGVDSLEGLEQRARQAAEQAQEADELRREASRDLERRAELGDVEEGVEKARERVRQAEAELAGLDRLALEDKAAELGDDALARIAGRRRELEERIQEVERGAHEASVARAALTARIESLDEQVATAREEHDRRLRELDGDWEAVIERASLEADEAAQQRAKANAELEGLQGGASGATLEAKHAVEEAKARLEEARTAEKRARDTRDEAQRAVSTLKGQLDERRRQVEAFDLEAAREQVEAARTALERAPVPEQPVSETTVEAAREAHRQAEARVRDLERQRDTARGALAHVGGEGEEWLADVRESFENTLRREQELEASYEAWQLLLEVLTEVQQEESHHLGRALVGPVLEQFKELTSGRYGSVSLGTTLTTEGVWVAGESREPMALSVGTREQLATILRLAIARELGSTVVLDDQLVQSDAERSERLAGLLRETDTQVVVLTARPEDYVDVSELPGNENGTAREVDGVRIVDLGRVIERLG